jgi:hypothetical protein
MSDRVSERRRAAQLARHYRDRENLTIAEIARRLGRAEATIKAYLYDPCDGNKRPTASPQERQFRALAGHARTSTCKRLSLRRHEASAPEYPICPDYGSVRRRWRTTKRDCFSRIAIARIGDLEGGLSRIVPVCKSHARVSRPSDGPERGEERD